MMSRTVSIALLDRVAVPRVKRGRLSHVVSVLSPCQSVGHGLPLLSTRPEVTPATLNRAATNLLLGEQGHDGREQFA